jgi:hypothetical protein
VVVACEDRSLRSYGKSGATLWRFVAGGRLTPHLSRSAEGTSYVAAPTEPSSRSTGPDGSSGERKAGFPRGGAGGRGLRRRVFILSERTSPADPQRAPEMDRQLPGRLSTPAVLDSEGGIVAASQMEPC